MDRELRVPIQVFGHYKVVFLHPQPMQRHSKRQPLKTFSLLRSLWTWQVSLAGFFSHLIFFPSPVEEKLNSGKLGSWQPIKINPPEPCVCVPVCARVSVPVPTRNACSASVPLVLGGMKLQQLCLSLTARFSPT